MVHRRGAGRHPGRGHAGLLLHIGTPRGGIPGCEFTMNLGELTGAGRSTTDYRVRYSRSAMIFAGVFDRYPKLTVGSVEHEAAWIPHWLKQMDFTYRERPVFTKGWRSKDGLLPSDRRRLGCRTGSSRSPARPSSRRAR